MSVITTAALFSNHNLIIYFFTQSGTCVRHLIRLNCNPLIGKQLIWLIILPYLLTLHSHKIQDFNTQPAWDYCVGGFVCLVMA